jgi:predicted MFS family arabinose efflux permease
VGFFPAAIFFALLFSIPRSARWLALHNRNAEARAVLQSMGSVDPDAEMNSIIESIHSDTSATAESLWKWKYRFPIFLAITIGMFNQLAGINAILYYLNDIFAAAGFSKVSGDLQAVGVGAMNLVATLLGMSLIDKAGRKTLLLIGAAGMVGCLSGVARIFSLHHHQNYLVWLLVAYIGFFAISQGSVIWVYIGEVFPNRVRAKGQSLGSSAHWITNAAIALTFPYVATMGSGAYPFVFFAAMTLIQFFVVLFIYPETKGVSLEQMQHKLGLD